jgi:peptidoglycan L-alanyl-D-glutamate endopeptidase CwlK
MRDKITLERANRLHPMIRQEVVALLEAAEQLLPYNCAIRMVQGLRTFEEQAILYAKGRTAPGRKVTNAKPGASFHQYGLAFDYALLYDLDGNGNFEKLSWSVNEDWKTVAILFEDNGYTWGGRWSKFVDAPHIEKTFGYTWRELLALHKQKKFIPGTTYIDL